MIATATPTRKYENHLDRSARPSWDRASLYVNDRHRVIFDQTKHLPGWQMVEDTYKLYEMAYYAGDVILEIGTYAGRSAAVELHGALSRTDRAMPPQFFGIDLNPEAIPKTYHHLQQEGVADHALLYHGTLQSFATEFVIRPTMVFVDGDHRYDGIRMDLETLSGVLEPGVPVLCHDYANPENDTGEYGVRRAAMEWEQRGFAECMGVFGCSGLFVTTAKCRGQGKAWPPEVFAQRREALLRKYSVL